MPRRTLFALLPLLALAGCPEVDPSNPFDPGTPAEQQAAGTVSGAVVLPADFGAARLAAGAVALWRRDTQVARIALTPEAGADPARASFAFESVVGGTYTLRVEVPGFTFTPALFQLAIGADAALGDLLLAPTASAASPDAPPTGLEGVAKRAGGGDTGHGGIRVDVVDTPYAAVTTDQGAWRLDLAPASYTLRFSAQGHEAERVADVAVTADGYTAVAEVVLMGAPARVFGRVAPPADFTADFDFAEVRVALWAADAAPDAEPAAEAPVDARGDYDFPGLDAGRYRLQAQRDGFVGTQAAVTLTAGAAVEAPPLSLAAIPEAQGLLTGVVRLGGAADHSAIRVELVGSALSATTNADGDWALQAPPGVHTLRFTRAGYGTQQAQAARLEPRGAVQVDEVVLVADPGAVRGQVRIDPRFAGRDLLPQVAVRLARIEADGRLSPAGEGGAQAAADDPELGTFAFAALAPGAYQVEARLEGFQPAFRAVEVAPGQAAATGILFLSPAAAEAAIVGQARRDCAGCEHGGIQVEAVGTPFVALTNAQGDFRLAVTAGQFTLRYTAPGYGAQVSAPIDVDAGAPAQAPAVQLAALPSRVVATVQRLDPDGPAQPAVGATATLADADGQALVNGQVGDGGALSLEVAGYQGPAVLTVRLPDHDVAVEPVAVALGQVTDLGALALPLSLGRLEGTIQAPGLADGEGFTVVAVGVEGPAAGRQRVVAGAPGAAAWAIAGLPVGGWAVTALMDEHLPSDPQAVQVRADQSTAVDAVLARRQVALSAPAVVDGDGFTLTVTADASITHARAWGAEQGDFQLLEAGLLQVPLPAEDGAYPLLAQVATAQAAGAPGEDPLARLLAYTSQPQPLTVVRDTTAPDVWGIQAPALVAAPEMTLTADCRDALAPADELSLQITVDGEPAFQGPYAPRIRLALPGADGLKVIEATCTDWAGHATEPLEATVRLDRAGPTVARFEVGDGTPNQVQAAASAPVTVALEDADAAVATAIEEGALDCAAANYRWPAGGTFVVPLPAGDGPRQLSLCAIDRAGNTTGPVQSNPFIVDSTAPAPGRLRLADGLGWAGAAQVALQIDTDEPGLRLALDGDVAPAEYAADAWPAQVTLLGADGPKVVTARLIDAAGNRSEPFSDTVALDRQAPAPGRVVVADGQAEVNARTVPIAIGDTNPDRMRFWEGDPAQACAAPAGCAADGFSPFSPATELTLSPEQGPKRVCWQLCDLAGNGAPVGQADLRLATYLPRPAPTLAALQPPVVQAFQGPAQITVTGAGIAADTQLLIGDFSVPCEGGPADCRADAPDGCADQCIATLPQALLRNAGTYAARLDTPGPGGGRSAVRFLSVVAPIATVVDLAPRGFTPFDADGDRVPTVELTVIGYDLLDNASFRLEAVSGEVVAVQPLDLEGVAADRPQRAVTVRFDAAPLPQPEDGARLTLSVTNPSPGGGTVQVPVGWNPELAACDVQAGCRSALDRFRTPVAPGGEQVAQAYFVDWPAQGGVAWRGGARARLLVEGAPSGLAAVAQAPVEVLPVPQSLGDGLVLEGPPVANPAVDLSTAARRTSGELLEDAYTLDQPELRDEIAALRVRDVTGDGWPDVVTVGREPVAGGRLAVTLSAGGPHVADPDRVGPEWDARRTLLGAGDLVGLELGDVDGDGWPDAVVALADAVLLLRGRAEGLAPPLRLAHAGPELTGLVLADWDADGRVDARLLDAQGGLHELRRRADGAIQLQALDGLGGVPLRTLTGGDVDGDGVVDLVGVSQSPEGAGLVAVLSTRGFTNPLGSAEAPTYPHPDLDLDAATPPPGPTLALGDLDGDGDLDAVHTDIGESVWVYQGLGDGRFLRRQVLPRGRAFGRDFCDLRHLQLVDLTGDGHLDLVYGAQATERLRAPMVAPGRGDGTFPDPQGALPRDLFAQDKAVVQVHDLDRDGLLDLVGHRPGGRFVGITPGVGGRPLDRLQGLQCDGCGDFTRYNHVDATGDGRPDVVLFGAGGLGVARLLPDGRFDQPRFQALPNGSNNARPAAGPWAADGGPAVILMERNAGGVQNPVVRIPVSAQGVPQAPQRILGDQPRRESVTMLPSPGGDPWLVTLRRDPDELVFRRYTPATNAAGAPTVRPLPADVPFFLPWRAPDVDGDGDQDLVLSSDAGLLLVRQDPAGLTVVGEPVGAGHCYDVVDAGDLDGDGHTDLVAGVQNESRGRSCGFQEGVDPGLTVFWGDGAFGFQPERIGGLGGNLAVADLNGDGLDDIAHAVRLPVPQLGQFISEPGRRFALPLFRRIEQPVHGAYASDLDGDGVMDVVLHQEGGLLSWLRASPIGQRFESRLPAPVTVAAGQTAQIELPSDRRHFARVGLAVRVQAEAGAEPLGVRVTVTAPDGRRLPLGGLQGADGWLRLNAAPLDLAGWQPAGAWQVAVANTTGQPVTVMDTRIIAVGGAVRALD